MPDGHSIGLRIRHARKDKGLNRTQLAAQLGVGERTVLRWEHGSVTPSIRRLTQLSAALDRPLMWLLEEDDERVAV